MTSVCLRSAVLLTVLSSFGTLATARAAEDSPDKALAEAKDDFETAQTLFVRGEYDAAAGKFLEAYGKKPYPAFLFNVAVSFEKAKQLDKAKQYFEKYLQDDPNATDAAQVKLRLDVIDKLLAPPAPAAPGTEAAPPATSAPPPVAAPLPAPVLPDIDTKGLLVIDSKPQGATIYLNDKRSGPFGKTPWHGSLES
ncbi:MAG TPA: hypothetical protein VLT58_03280, partial [Polyangia bacterium]|nr:hypothetical protein [Polyangia bacterium]